MINRAQNNLVERVYAAQNGDGIPQGDYGIDLREGNTSGNTIRGVYVTANFDEGVHFGGGSFDNLIEDSYVVNNAAVGIYLTATAGVTVRRNVVTSANHGSGGIRLVNTSDSLIEANDLLSASILLDGGDSSGNVFRDNDIGLGRFRITNGAHHNLVDGLTVGSGLDDHCVEFTDAGGPLPFGNRITSADLSCGASERELFSDGSGGVPSQNLVCASTCRNASGNPRGCVDNGNPNDDVLDRAHIITLQAAPCP